jgi:spermidine/putrescine transport system ATP-binding protein
MDSSQTEGARAVIALENVHKRFGALVAVEDADFTVRRGEFFSIVGPSGCGKTTLLRLIAGFEDVTSGRIRLDGVDVSGVPPYRRNVNTVFQHYALFPHLTVFDNIAFGPRSRRCREADVRGRVARMLEVVRLGDVAARRPDQLSGGQRQRVALARALVNLPSALLLDEPLSALDLQLRQAMQSELKRVQREVSVAFVFVTHDQDEALAMSDRIAVMQEGRIEQVGTPEEIYRAPASLFVAGFIGTANLLPATVESVSDGRAVVRLMGDHRADVATDQDGFAPGAGAIVMVRPEHVRLTTGAPHPSNAIPVTVVEMVFRGPVVRCVLRDAAGVEIVAHVDGEDRPTGVGYGATIWATWDAAASRLLPRRPAPASGPSTALGGPR